LAAGDSGGYGRRDSWAAVAAGLGVEASVESRGFVISGDGNGGRLLPEVEEVTGLNDDGTNGDDDELRGGDVLVSSHCDEIGGVAKVDETTINPSIVVAKDRMAASATPRQNKVLSVMSNLLSYKKSVKVSIGHGALEDDDSGSNLMVSSIAKIFFVFASSSGKPIAKISKTRMIPLLIGVWSFTGFSVEGRSKRDFSKISHQFDLRKQLMTPTPRDLREGVENSRRLARNAVRLGVDTEKHRELLNLNVIRPDLGVYRPKNPPEDSVKEFDDSLPTPGEGPRFSVNQTTGALPFNDGPGVKPA